MTLMPVEEVRVKNLSYEEEETQYRDQLNMVCAVPGCMLMPERGAHHIVPRRATGGPRDFVVIDGLVVPNRVRLCSPHHGEVTGEVGGHKAKIVWDPELPQGWGWWVADEGWVYKGPLNLKKGHGARTT